MNICLFCQNPIAVSVSFSFIVSLKKLQNPKICTTCLHEFEEIIMEKSCSGCSRPQKNQSFCSDCKKWVEKHPEIHLNHRALYTYNKKSKEYMQGFKFQGDLVLAELFREQIRNSLLEYQKSHHIVPIPISKESMKVRGFSQVELILEKSGIEFSFVKLS